MNSNPNPIEAAVRPLKKDAMRRATEYAIGVVANVEKRLLASNNDLEIAAPYPQAWHGSRAEYFVTLATYNLFRRLTTSRASSRGMHDPNYADMNTQGIEAFVKDAREDAAFQYEAYIAKLNKKIGPVTAASLEGNHVWGFSILTVTKANGGTERWKTQTIINQSKLGKVFNQFPTRLMPSYVIEMLAQQLHREYRAAEKACRLPVPHLPSHDGVTLFHDHGWKGCHKKDYFRKRAALLLKRSSVINPETLDEAEQAMAATVLLRRLSAEGKLIAPRFACGGVLPPTTRSYRVTIHSENRISEAVLEKIRKHVEKASPNFGRVRTNAIAGQGSQRGVR
jgi:hypothetical protein